MWENYAEGVLVVLVGIYILGIIVCIQEKKMKNEIKRRNL